MCFEFRRKGVPTARKQHDCNLCPVTIDKGEQYTQEAGKIDGQFFSLKSCSYCTPIEGHPKKVSSCGESIDTTFFDKELFQCLYVDAVII